MIYFLESPFPFLLIGILIVALLLGAWSQTGHRWTFVAAVICSVITGGLLALERFVETEREQITATLYEIADRVEKNELEQSLRYIHPAATGIEQRVKAEMPRYDFRRVTVKSNLKIEMQDEQQPPQAKATFNVVVVLNSGPLQGVEGRSIPRYVEVTFRKDGEQWRVFDYEHHDPRQGFMRP